MNADLRQHVARLLEEIDGAEPFRRRAVQEAISDALATTWKRRAEALRDALPRPDDYRGGPVDFDNCRPLFEGVAPDLARIEELAGAARACFSKAALLEARWIE